MELWKTNISPVLYGPVTTGSTADESPVCWLDEMLYGGLLVPDGSDNESPFVLVLSGKPGTGKSTFALQLCARMSRPIAPAPPDPDDDAPGGANAPTPAQRTPISVYLSTESTAKRIIEQIERLGWDRNKFLAVPAKLPKNSPTSCFVCGTEYTRKALGGGAGWLNIAKILRMAAKLKIRRDKSQDPVSAEILVIDSVNVAPVLGRQHFAAIAEEVFRAFGDGRMAPRLIVMVIDGESENAEAAFWEHKADAVFRFGDEFGPDGYFQRHFQIKKMRFQPHAWGRHTLKLFPPARDLNRNPIPNNSGIVRDSGVFIFPSIHWHLSRQPRSTQPSEDDPRTALTTIPTPLTELNVMLADSAECQGFPSNHTTALVGYRGGMKSYLAYYFMVQQIIGKADDDPDAKHALLISLRDDKDAATLTLGNILENEQLAAKGSGAHAVHQLMNSDRLEILYNRPGNIAPGEFFHRIFVALTRQRSGECCVIDLGGGRNQRRLVAPARPTPQIVVLNGLDHLAAKFPLCSVERNFLPSLVLLFQSHGVCSIVISAEDSSRSDADSATNVLRAMAELTLEFSPIRGDAGNDAQKSQVLAARVPAGQMGGRYGVLSRASCLPLAFQRTFHGETRPTQEIDADRMTSRVGLHP